MPPLAMESRAANLMFRLWQRHLSVPWPVKQSPLPRLLPRVPLSFDASGKDVVAAGSRLPYFDVSCNGSPRESEGVFSHVERTRFENFVMQPESSLSLLDWESDVVRVQALVKAKLSVVQAWNGESCEPDCGLKLGLRLRSGMYLPSRQEEEGWELSSVKRKRKKKMNKHKQRKLRRRDRHRK